jgi:uncharacterized membrane protein
MIRPENFIYFLTVCGFFIGIIFSMVATIEPAMVLWTTISITAVFYMIGLASTSWFIKHIDIKAAYTLNRDYYEEQLDKARDQIEKRESYIRDSTRFIRKLEEEILQKKDEDLI